VTEPRPKVRPNAPENQFVPLLPAGSKPFFTHSFATSQPSNNTERKKKNKYLRVKKNKTTLPVYPSTRYVVSMRKKKEKFRAERER